jgi:hypothetical protein
MNHGLENHTFRQTHAGRSLGTNTTADGLLRRQHVLTIRISRNFDGIEFDDLDGQQSVVPAE